MLGEISALQSLLVSGGGALAAIAVLYVLIQGVTKRIEELSSSIGKKNEGFEEKFEAIDGKLSDVIREVAVIQSGQPTQEMCRQHSQEITELRVHIQYMEKYIARLERKAKSSSPQPTENGE